jgi:hypothetical protein
LRPAILLSAHEVQQARRMRRSGMEPEAIADSMGKPLDEVEKALVQMRMPRPETTRGTLNVTLAAHQVVMRERRGDEPIWQTFDRIIDELLRLRAEAAARAPDAKPPRPAGSRQRPAASADLPMLPGLIGLA